VTSQKYQFTIDPEIAKITSGVEYIPFFSLGQNLDQHSNESSHAPIDISFNVVKDISYDKLKSQKFHFFFGLNDADEIYYERQLPMGVKFKMKVEDLLNQPKITVNETYYKYVRIRIENIYPPGVHLVDIVTLNLLRKMYAPLHCAALSCGKNKGILIVAPPNMGKTLTTFLALKKGFRFLAEDIAFVDTKSVYGNPHTSTFLHNEYLGGEVKESFNLILWRLARKFEIEDYVRTPRISIRDILKNVKIDDSAKIYKIFILDRGETQIRKINAREAFRRILLINRNEFSYSKNPLIFAYAYLNPSIDLNELMRIEENIIDTIVKANDCYAVTTNDPKKYVELLLNTVSCD
jgi:hypothetical protein